ncbi:MAG TPA: PepSY domain-containing protein, partial [Thermoflexales bacterium]|nr:PepSY domain-containing protein [Thermoflexales bacterium]
AESLIRQTSFFTNFLLLPDTLFAMKQSTGLLIAAGVTAIVMACAGTTAAGIAAINAVDRASSAQERQQPAQNAPQAAPQPNGPVVELDQGTAVPTQTQNAQPTVQTTRLSSDEAVAIAMRLARGASLLETPALVTLRRNVQAYEIKLDVGTLYIDANTGRLLGVTRPQNPQPTPGSHGERENENTHTAFKNYSEQEHNEND